MSGSSTAARFSSIVVAHGEPMTLRRQTVVNPATFTDVTVKGKRFRPNSAGSDELAGSVGQNRITVKISNAEIAAASWPGPPAKGDRLVMAGRTYVLEADADTRWDSGVIQAHFLLVKG